MTKPQTQLLHIAVKQVGLNDRQYRMILRTVCEVASSTQLDNKQFEQVMAVLEDRGFRLTGKPETWFRDKAAMQGSTASDRQIALIHKLASHTPYPPQSIVWRITNHEKHQPEELDGGEAYKVIEALKGILSRAGKDWQDLPELPPATRTGRLSAPQPGLFGEISNPQISNVKSRRPVTVPADDEPPMTEDEIPF